MTTAAIPPAERHAAARALFESIPNITHPEIAKQVGVTALDVKNWRQGDADAGVPWKAAHVWDSVMAEKAQALAQRFHQTQLAPEDQALADPAEAEARAVADFSRTVGIEVRAELLQRHQQEWVGPRALIYQSMKLAKAGKVAAGYELAKLAKISAETVSLVQQGERRAFGIKPDEGEGPLVVIERGDGA